MPGEYPSARRRSARWTRGRRAGTEHDPPGDDSGRFGLTGSEFGLPSSGTAESEAAEAELAQPAWSDAWMTDSGEGSRDRPDRRPRKLRDQKHSGQEHSGQKPRDQKPRGQWSRERDGRPDDHESPDEENPDDDPRARARQICLRQLALAPKTRAQLKDAMRKRDIPEEVAEFVLSRYTDVGLIDDAAFARAWVESRHYGKGLAGRALKAELRRRGVADNDIKDAVATIDPDSEVETARRLVERKLASTAGQPAQVRTRRLAGMLGRKGYPPGLAFRVIREALEAEGADEPQVDDAFADPLDDCDEPYTE